jgi:hypothetical protein
MKPFSIILLAIIAAFLLNSCDKLESPYINVPAFVDTAACPVPDFPALITPQKRVLLEDYTGHTCPNCPTAGKLAMDLKDQYPGQLVVMAVHAGWFARTYPESGVPQIFDYDFRTTAGNEWDAYFGNGNAGNPNGLVNRLKVNNKYVLRPNEWAGVISSALAEEPLLELQMIVDYDPADRKICAHVQTLFLQTLDRNLKIEAVIIEDNIIAAQKNNDPSIGIVGDIEDFVHMHVVRGTLNGTWGSTLSTIGTPNPASFVKTLQSVLPADCDPDQCHIVAFVFDETTKEVLQVVETGLTE